MPRSCRAQQGATPGLYKGPALARDDGGGRTRGQGRARGLALIEKRFRPLSLCLSLSRRAARGGLKAHMWAMKSDPPQARRTRARSVEVADMVPAGCTLFSFW